MEFLQCGMKFHINFEWIEMLWHKTRKGEAGRGDAMAWFRVDEQGRGTVVTR